jgi:hypothetical protein
LQKTSEIWFESRAMQASTDARAKAIIAHELGHLRSRCDPEINQDDRDLAEHEADRYAKQWGHRLVDNVYKTGECDELQKFARHLSMSWRIFYVDGFFGTHLTCLMPGDRIRAKFPDFDDIGVNSEEVRDHMRILPPRYYVRRR